MAKVKVTADLREINQLVPRVRKSFSDTAPIPIREAIRSDIQRGVSPVKGQGRFEKYSPSYRAQIRGEAAFRTGKNGKVYAITALKNKELKSLRASKKARSQNKSIKEKIKEINKVFLSYGKRAAPVNMTLSGKMMSSLIVIPSGNFTKSLRLLIAFKDDVADFHNNRGAAGKTVRRLLPTNQGERFNTNIDSKMRTLLNKSVASIVKKFK